MGNTLESSLVPKISNSHNILAWVYTIREPYALSIGSYRIYDMQGFQQSESLQRGAYIVILTEADGRKHTMIGLSQHSVLVV